MNALYHELISLYNALNDGFLNDLKHYSIENYSIDLYILNTLPMPDDMIQIWSSINENGFIFNDFTLIVEPIKTTFKVSIEGRKEAQVFHIKVIEHIDLIHTKTTCIDTNIDEMFDNYADMMHEVVNNGYTKDAINNPAAALIMPFHFMQYVIYSALHRTIEYIEPVEHKAPAATTKHKKSKTSNQEYNLTDCIKIYQKKNPRKKYEYTCPAWPVRGFFRHNKNGTVSWVNPDPNGKDRDKLKDRNYTF